MIAQIKKSIQKPMIQKRHRLYEARIASQTVPYDVWFEQLLKQQSLATKNCEGNGISVQIVEFEEACACHTTEDLLDKYDAEIFLFVRNKTGLVENAIALVQCYMQEKDCDLFYADEAEYFKTDYSPELLEAFFYFGNVFGVKKHVLSMVKTGFDNLEYMVKKCLEYTGKVGHMQDILYLGSFDADVDTAKVSEKLLLTDVDNHNSDIPRVSIIIPSKDNPAVLSSCIHSLLENTEGMDCCFQLEVIVVDNGSNEENKKRIEKMRDQLQENYQFRYYHESMPFNFSHMCNMGAALATGEYLLFLNDDIEIRDSKWLLKMMYQAMKPEVGAVGAKLLYPDGERIQHVGITNIHLGPAHKLQFSSDKQVYYNGYNRLPVNVLAVTGACMLMKREAYEKTGGFDETLQVSFNDVEICFNLYTLGYRNVCCNHTYLYHHESLSRGADAGLAKVRRLHGERDYLYGKYPKLWNYDPYYSDKFVRDILDDGFETAHRFAEENMSRKSAPVEITGKLDGQWYNQCLYMGIEFAGSEMAWKQGPGKVSQDKNYYIQGWSYAIQVDNSRYEKKLLLKPICFHENGEIPEKLIRTQQLTDGPLWELAYTPVYRPDMAAKLPYIDRPDLTGVSVWFEKGSMPSGEYLIGYLWEDTCSRQKLYAFTAETIVIL